MPGHHDYGIDPEHFFGGTPDDDLPPCCPVCGAGAEWVSCDAVGCDDGYYHDCGEDCCCCADPEPNTPCGECNGKGGWRECTQLPHTEYQMAEYRKRSGS